MYSIHILHLEDSDADAELITVRLKLEFPECAITRVDNRNDFIEELKTRDFNLVLADFNLPGFSGMDALNVTRELEPHIPFIFLSGTIGEELAVEALRLGATDYVLKNRVDKLPFVINRALNEQKQKKQTLQFQSMLLSSQINPHFIFNALNSIQYYILDNKTVPALDFVSEFSRLMRTTLENSLQKFITLTAEIEFLKLYLELEKKRFNYNFDYEIEVEEEVDNNDCFIPPMLLQPYIENTVVHGLSNRETGGKVRIYFQIRNDELICTITDNGIGRKRAMELRKLRVGESQHRSLGMSILDTRLNLLHELTGKSYNVLVKDLKNARGEAMGTRIRIWIPVITENSKVHFIEE